MDVEVEQAQPLAPCRAGTVEGQQRGHTRFGARVSCAGRVGPWAKIAVTGLARSRDGVAGAYGGRSRLQRIKNGEHHGVLRKVRRSFEYGTFDGTLLCSELRRVIRESIVDSQSCHRGSHRSDLEGSGRATLAGKAPAQRLFGQAWTTVHLSRKNKVVGSIPIRRLQMTPGRLSSEASDTRG